MRERGSEICVNCEEVVHAKWNWNSGSSKQRIYHLSSLMALGKQPSEQANTQKRITKRLAGFLFLHSSLFISQLFCFAVRVFEWVCENEMTNARGS